MAAKICVRCGAETFGKPEDQPHLCKDVARRLARRERQVDAVMALDTGVNRHQAEAIVTVLAGLGVTED